MCELQVFINGKIVFRDVVYAKAEDGGVVVKDITGVMKRYQNCVIEEIDIDSTRLVLSKT